MHPLFVIVIVFVLVLLTQVILKHFFPKLFQQEQTILHQVELTASADAKQAWAWANSEVERVEGWFEKELEVLKAEVETLKLELQTKADKRDASGHFIDKGKGRGKSSRRAANAPDTIGDTSGDAAVAKLDVPAKQAENPGG